MKSATPSTLLHANGGATQDGNTKLPPSIQLRKVVFGGNRFPILCAAPKKQFGIRTTCVTRLLPLLLLLTLSAALQAQYNFLENYGALTITPYNCFTGAVAIPSTINGRPVTSIGDMAFLACSSLTSVTMPNSVTNIGYGAFNACTSLTTVTIPTNVASIGDAAFSDCTSLSAITVDEPNSFYSSIDGVLFNKSQTTLMQYPAGKAGSYTIPNSVTSIAAQAFFRCTSLTNVTIPNSVTSIGFATFLGCSSMTNVTIPDSVTNIEGNAFYGCTSLTSVTIPNRVTSIGDYAFYYCASLDSVTIGNNVTSIGLEAFAVCTSLTSVTIPNSLTRFGNQAFNYCSNLISVTIPNGVTNIGDSAFYGCTSLTTVMIGIGVTSIGRAAFSGCPSLSAIAVDALNSFYSSVDGVLFNKSQTTLIQYPWGKAGSYTIPNSATSIAGQAFYGCTNLTSVTIPNSVTNIGDYAFYGCTSLTAGYFKGNTPSIPGDQDLFGDKTIVYYLPGTTGWGATFGGRPAVLWNPQILNSDASFAVRTNRFGFTITGANNLVIVVEASTNLAKPAWIPVGTNTLTGSSSYFSDPQWTNSPARFYRLRSP